MITSQGIQPSDNNWPNTIELMVDLGARSYPIHIGAGVRKSSALYRQAIAGHQVLVVTDTTVAPLYLADVEEGLEGFAYATLVLPDGEVNKTLDSVQRIFDALIEHRFERSATLLALGGGVIGDMTGFAAACYQRGVSFIQVPTTLLAQVDSSVGGKTGVNHPGGKNMIGAFHQPRAVIIDTATLDTLDDRQLRAGLAEVIKYGLIRDAEFFAWLEQAMPSLLARDKDALGEAIARSCRCKAQVVAEDEHEAGVRALLNLGHTFGHAIETGTGYGNWLHGEAVATGTVLAADLSVRLGWLEPAARDRLVALYETVGLPVVSPEGMTRDDYLRLMAIDKKVSAGRLRLVLLRAIGDALVTAEFDPGALDAALEAACTR
jgi:3-dehydroquinate synthase